MRGTGKQAMPGKAAEATHLVVASQEEHSSIHTPDAEFAGWREADGRDACLAPVGAVWTGTRPRGLRTAEPAAR
jgi:uncharacterized protein YbdZ (MbtH family)